MKIKWQLTSEGLAQIREIKVAINTQQFIAKFKGNFSDSKSSQIKILKTNHNQNKNTFSFLGFKLKISCNKRINIQLMVQETKLGSRN